jgi:hypothetical protein
VGALLLGIASSLQFEGHTLAIAWTLEAAVLSLGTLFMTRRRIVAQWTTLTFIPPILACTSYVHLGNTPNYADAGALFLLALSLLTTGSALTLWQDDADTEPSTAGSLLISVGAVNLFASAAALMTGALLTCVWTAIAFSLTLVLYALTKKQNLAVAGAICFVFPIVRSFEHMTASSWDTGFIHGDALALLLIGTALIALGALVRNPASQKGTTVRTHIFGVDFTMFTLGSIYYAMILWLAAPSLVGHDFAVMTVLVIYTLVGLGFYLTGRLSQSIESTVYGSLLLGFVVLRLLFVDVWQMELSGRVVTFLLIGALLMATAFVGRSRKQTTTPV